MFFLILSGKKVAGGIIPKKSRKTITLEKKFDILRRIDKREKTIEIAKTLGLPVTTIKSINNRDREKIREAAKSATSLGAKAITRKKSLLIVKMESLLTICINNQISQQIPISKMVIQTKARSLFNDLNKQLLDEDQKILEPIAL